jgi:two-component system OmpR family response regulator
MASRPLRQILVVDDDPDLLAVVSLALTGLGGKIVETCSSAVDAVEAARQFAPDLILLDVMMPGLDGFAVVQAIRDHPATSATPVVFMSARAKRAPARAEQLECLGIIQKPFDPVDLPEKLEELWAVHVSRRLLAHQREFEVLRRAYICELAEKMRAMQAAAATLAADGWDRSVVESLAHLAHRVAGSAGLYRLPALSRSAAALEEIVNRLLSHPAWPPATAAGDLARLVQAVDRAARQETSDETGNVALSPDRVKRPTAPSHPR